MRRYYHVYTKGLEDDVMFRTNEDYVAGMNYVPVSIVGLDVLILAFVLMSNHVHFIVYGVYEEVYNFIEMYKNLIGRYARNRYGVKEMLRRVGTGVSPIPESAEELKQKIAYVLNNPLAAGINCFPITYEWGSGRCYFNASPSMGRPLSSFSRNDQKKMMRTHKLLSQSYLVTEQGYVHPCSYVSADLVEKLYYKANSFNYYLGTQPKRSSSLLISDTLLSNIVDEIIDKQYGGLYPSQLSNESLSVLLKEMNRRFNASPKQIARVLKVPLQEVVSILKR